MDIYAVFMGAAFAGMAVFFGLLVVLFRSWAKSKEPPAQPQPAPVREAPYAAARMPVAREPAPTMRERELHELLSAVATLTREMEETANTIFRRFEQKERRLELLIKEADAAIARAGERQAAAPALRQYATVEELAPAPRQEAPVPPAPRATAQGKYAKAAELMALGKTASDVSRELSLHVGELELINNLRKIGM